MGNTASFLKKISISGFKSIKKCDLSLNSINILIGSNGAGKSNFVSVFTMFRDIINRELQFHSQQVGVNSLFFDGRKKTDVITFEYSFENVVYGISLAPTDDNRIIIKQEYCTFDGKKSIIASSREESGWQASEFSESGCFPDFNKIKVYHFHDTGRNAKVKQEHNVSNSILISEDASNIAAFLYRLKNMYSDSYRDIVETVRIIAPYFDDFILEPQEWNREHIILKWRQKYSDDVFNASQFSDGTLRFICLAVLLLQPSELQPDIIVIDEPELGLHPYAVSVFAELVKRVSFKKQMIISTQSVELLNEFESEDVIVVDRENNSSVFRRINGEELKIWLENDYSLGELWQKNLLGGRLS